MYNNIAIGHLQPKLWEGEMEQPVHNVNSKPNEHSGLAAGLGVDNNYTRPTTNQGLATHPHRFRNQSLDSRPNQKKTYAVGRILNSSLIPG